MLKQLLVFNLENHTFLWNYNQLSFTKSFNNYIKEDNVQTIYICSSTVFFVY